MKLAKEKATEKKLEKLCKDLLSITKKKGEVSVQLLSDKEMTSLKQAYFYKKKGKKTFTNKPVDVLAFPEPKGFPHPEKQGKVLGDIYLNKELLSDDLPRLKLLTIHGLLHLLGYRHHLNRDMIEMEKMEKKLWHRIS